MKQNSNYTITKAVVDATSQEVADIYVNGNNHFTAEASLEDNKTVSINAVTGDASTEIEPSDAYNAMKKVTLTLDKSGIKNNQSTTVAETFTDEVTITIPEGEAWTGTVTITKA